MMDSPEESLHTDEVRDGGHGNGVESCIRTSAIGNDNHPTDSEQEEDAVYSPQYDASLSDWSASRIQAWYRGVLQARRLKRMRAAVRVVQSAWRTWQIAQTAPRERANIREASVARIQRAWRSFWDRRVFKFFRDLIKFRERGDPALVLRSINPAEAGLAERAAGVHVRFRLGGSVFPPTIYYKIYTHRPVTDMCSFSPRDYALMAKSKRKPALKHTKPLATISENVQRVEITEGEWYKRWENNGWRPVTQRWLTSHDPITSSTSSIRRTFHHMRVVRREERAAAAKQRKVMWMKQLYAAGKSENSEVSNVSDGVVYRNEVETRLIRQWEEMEARGQTVEPAAVKAEGEDEEDLLSWSTELDFDNYHSNWLSLATSAYTSTILDLDAFYMWQKENPEVDF